MPASFQLVIHGSEEDSALHSVHGELIRTYLDVRISDVLVNAEICFKDAALISKISFDDPLANAVKMTRLDDTRVRVLSIGIKTWTKYNGSGEN